MTIKNGIELYKWCIENNMPIEQQTLYNKNTTSVSIIPKIQTRVWYENDGGAIEKEDIPVKYRKKIIAMDCCVTYKDGKRNPKVCHNIKEFQEFLKEI